MTEYPLVSILVANFNNGQFITETLDSAVGQTYPNIEVVIVDDGSMDNSVSIIEDYISKHGDTRFKFYRNDDNQGCGRIKRQCVAYSEGAFFAFLDPEDTIVPEALETLMKVHIDHPEFSVVYCTHYLCNERLEPQSISTYPGTIPQGQSHLTSTGGHISALAICKRRDYDKTTGIDASFEVAEDQDLYLKMEEQAPVCFVDSPLYYYRKHDHNSSWNESKAFNNYYWRYYCTKAAYLRRREQGSTVDNLSKHDMDKMSFSFFVRLGKERWKKGACLSSCFTYLRAVPYLYAVIV